VPHPEIIRYDIETSSVKDIVYVLNPYDRVALEEAVRIKEMLEKVKVTVITLGPPEAEDILRFCLAMGADNAILLLVNSYINNDAFATSLILSKAISLLPYDMILCGAVSIDDNSAFVGPGISEFLNLPLISNVTKMNILVEERKIIAYRRVRKVDREVVECALPAVITVDIDLNEPRYVSSEKILKVREKEITKLNIESLNVDLGSIEAATKVIRYTLPKPRLKKVTYFEGLSPAERLKMIMTGGTPKKSSRLIQKSPQDAVSEIIQFLINIGVLSNE